MKKTSLAIYFISTCDVAAVESVLLALLGSFYVKIFNKYENLLGAIFIINRKKFHCFIFLSEPLPLQFPLLLSPLPQDQLHNTSDLGPNLPVFLWSRSVALTPPALFFLSLAGLHLSHLCASVASSTKYRAAKCLGWKQVAQQFFLRPGANCPFRYVLSVHYYFTRFICISLETASVYSVFTASSFQFDPYFPLVGGAFSPFSPALLSPVSSPSKTPYLTSAAGLPRPIFSLPFRNYGFPPILSTCKMPSSSAPPSFPSTTCPISSSQLLFLLNHAS